MFKLSPEIQEYWWGGGITKLKAVQRTNKNVCHHAKGNKKKKRKILLRLVVNLTLKISSHPEPGQKAWKCWDFHNKMPLCLKKNISRRIKFHNGNSLLVTVDILASLRWQLASCQADLCLRLELKSVTLLPF